MKRAHGSLGCTVVPAALLGMLLLLLASCSSGLHLKHHRGWMGPDTWELTDGDSSVYYYDGDCCCVAEKVMEIAKERFDRGELNWQEATTPNYDVNGHRHNTRFNEMVRPICDSLRRIQWGR